MYSVDVTEWFRVGAYTECENLDGFEHVHLCRGCAGELEAGTYAELEADDDYLVVRSESDVEELLVEGDEEGSDAFDRRVVTVGTFEVQCEAEWLDCCETCSAPFTDEYDQRSSVVWTVARLVEGSFRAVNVPTSYARVHGCAAVAVDDLVEASYSGEWAELVSAAVDAECYDADALRSWEPLIEAAGRVVLVLTEGAPLDWVAAIVEGERNQDR